jgi:Tfp pilus assembly protein PilF
MTTLYFAIQWHVLTSGSVEAVKAHHMDNPVYTLLTMLRVLYDYIKNLLLPFWLNNRYVDRLSFSVFETKIMISIGVLLVLAGFLLIKIRQGEKLSLFCVGWFFITLSPVLNIIPISTKMADRYLYLPAIGIFLWISSSLYDLLVKKEPRVQKLSVFLCLIIAMVFTFSILTFQRNKVWKNGETLWTDSLKKDPVNSIAHNNLGVVLGRQGRLDEAISHFTKALKIKPEYVEAHNNLGVELARQGNLKEAIDHFSEALRIKPDCAEAYNNWGGALYHQGNLEKAITHFREAVRIKPDYAEAHNNWGGALYGQGKLQEAIAHYSEALKIRPDYTDARRNLSLALRQAAKHQEVLNTLGGP